MNINNQATQNGTVTKRLLIISIAILVVLLLAIVMLLFFISGKFAKGTSINGVFVGGQSAKVAITKIEELEQNSLQTAVPVNTINGATYNLERKELGFSLSEDKISNGIGDIYNKQSISDKFTSIFFTKQHVYDIDIGYELQDESIFYNKIKSYKDLQNPDEQNIIKPVNSQLKYDNEANKYIISDAVLGNEVSKDGMENLKNALQDYKTTAIDLQSINFYTTPDVTPDNEILIESCDIYNNRLNTIINIKVEGEDHITITPRDYLKAIRVNYEVQNSTDVISKISQKEPFAINTEIIGKITYDLLASVTTLGTTHTFINVNGDKLSLPGNYGWWVNYKTTAQLISEEITKGINNEQDSNTPPTVDVQFRQKAGSFSDKNGSDLGDSYIEISLEKQHLWMIEDGQVILDSPCVTGRPATGDATSRGVFALTYKERDAILKGTNYRTPVSFWMPFDGDIGMHDANWQPTFGGTRYITHGSNGCINLPFDIASTIFNKIGDNNAVIVY